MKRRILRFGASSLVLLGLFVMLQAPSVWGQGQPGPGPLKPAAGISAGAGIVTNPPTINTFTTPSTVSANFTTSGVGDNGSATTVARGDHAHDLSYVRLTGSTMSGPLIIPANSLQVGSSQIVTSAGRVGIGTSPSAFFDVRDTKTSSPATPGINADFVFFAMGGLGGDTPSGGGTGGAGGQATMIGGAGGTQTSDNHTGGLGAALTVFGGGGGKPTLMGGGDGGRVFIAGGDGGTASGAGVNANGGSILLNPGNAGTGAPTAGNPGNVVIASGNAGKVLIGTATPTTQAAVKVQVHGGDVFVGGTAGVADGIILQDENSVCWRFHVNLSGVLVNGGASVTCP